VFDEVVQVGGLMSYGIRIVDSVRRVPYFIDRILKGARPAEIPVEQPDRFYLVINLKTAKALGLALPLSLLLRADQVIDP
jgi:putative ABC transport system substrate-binding protein